jgi:hypothetical protein
MGLGIFMKEPHLGQSLKIYIIYPHSFLFVNKQPNSIENCKCVGIQDINKYNIFILYNLELFHLIHLLKNNKASTGRLFFSYNIQSNKKCILFITRNIDMFKLLKMFMIKSLYLSYHTSM